MARNANAVLLDTGDRFPRLELNLTTGRRLVLPDELKLPHNVILVNRGAWCPFCTAQLKAFQSGLPRLAQEGIGVVSFSTDTQDQATRLVADNGLDFPVGYGASVDAVAGILGVYYDPHPAHTAPHLQSAGFVVGPEGRVLTAVYSSGAIGRLVWQDVLGFVQYVKAHG